MDDIKFERACLMACAAGQNVITYAYLFSVLEKVPQTFAVRVVPAIATIWLVEFIVFVLLGTLGSFKGLQTVSRFLLLSSMVLLALSGVYLVAILPK